MASGMFRRASFLAKSLSFIRPRSRSLITMRAATIFGLSAVSVALLMTGVAASTSLSNDSPRPAVQAGPGQPVQMAALFGESDEEKAARQQHEDNQDLATQALSQRVHDLEETLRQ